MYVKLKEEKLTVTVWFDFAGHFTNKVIPVSLTEWPAGLRVQ